MKRSRISGLSPWTWAKMSVATRPGQISVTRTRRPKASMRSWLRQHGDRGLGRVVGRVAAEIVGAGDRGDVDHVAAVAGHHAGHDQAAEMQHGPNVHVDQEVDVAVLGLQELLRPVDARVVDEDVELDLAGEPDERRPCP